MPPYRYTDPVTKKSWISKDKLTPDELDEAFGENQKPISQIDAKDPQDSSIHGINLRSGLATATRVVPPVVTALTGYGALATGIVAAGSEALAEKIEGRSINPLEVAAGGAIGGAGASTLIAGPAKTIAGTVVKGAAFGAGSETLDALARGEGPPSVMSLALATLFGGAAGGVSHKLQMRTAAKEVLPKEVADEAHSVLTEGKFTQPSAASPAEVQELQEVKAAQKAVQRDAKGRFMKAGMGEAPTPKPKIRLHIGDQPHEVIPPAEPGSKTKWVKTGKGEWVRKETTVAEPPPDAPHGGGEGGGGDLEEPPSPLTKVHMSILERPMWAFDRMQKETGLPLYDDVWKPIHESMGDWEKLNEVLKDVEKRFVKAPGIDKSVKTAVGRYAQVVRGVHDQTFQTIENGIKRARRALPIFGKEIDDETARRWTYNIISSPYTELLGARVGPAIRVFSHTFQTGYAKLGERWLGYGIKRALTKKGMKDAISLGGLGPEHFELPEEVLATEGKTWWGRLQKIGFSMFRTAQDKSRAIIFHGAYGKALEAARDAKGDVASFIDKAGLDYGIPQAEAVKIGKVYAQGNAHEAARLAGIAHADSYIPTHSRADRPMLTTSSTIGQMAGGFYNWPNFYASVLKQNVIGLGGAGPARKRALFTARWALANSILAGTAYETYHAFDDKHAAERAAGFSFFGPVIYEGGPAIETFQHMQHGVRRTYTGIALQDPKMAWQGVKEFGKAAPIPFKYAAQDVIQYGLKLKKSLEDR